MPKKLALLLLFISTLLSAKTFTDEEFLQIVAETLDTNNNIVNAQGNVVVYSPTFYITAKKLLYDKKNSKLELFGDVNLVKNNDTISFSQYLFMDLKTKVNKIKPAIFIDNEAKLWFNATNAQATQNNYDLTSSTLSSCDCKDPSWSIKFSSGDYNKENQWVNTYNTRLYIKDIPVLYTPYFGFPTDRTRRSGLLKPTIGFSQNEGFLYAQPIYFAPKDNFDFEYIPQNRVKRGTGQALKYRYKDSLYSSLKIETATFREKDSYKEEYNLLNSKHYGWDLEYERTKLFSGSNSTDGLLIKSVDMNDVDYVNTQYNNDSNNYTNKFLESKIKYFYNNNSYYGDVDIRLYNDISKDNNDDVLQNIPTINLHKYSNKLFFDDLSYSLNLTSSRKTRDIGLEGKTTQISAPISFHKSIFNDYLNLTFSEQINYANITYSNNSNNYEDVNYGTNNHIVSLYTDLIKPYENYLHTINISTTYTKPENFKKTGDIYSITSNNTDLSILPVTKTNQSISFGLNQSIYNKSTLKQIVNHKINQLYVYNETEDKYEKNDLENDLVLYYDYGSLSNRFRYNYDLREVTNSTTAFKFLKDNYFFNTNYSYSKNKDTLVEQKDLQYDLGLSFYKYYKASYLEEYDRENHISKKKQYMLNIDKKCWAVNLKLVDSLVATTSSTNDVLRQNILYIEFDFKQLFQLAQSYKFNEKGQ